MRLDLHAPAILGDVLGLLLLLAPARVHAADGLWLQPSSKWLGIDGTWSTFELAVGGPAVTVQLTPNTALSEIWVVGKSSCGPPQCVQERGGVYDPKTSRSFSPLGTWALGLTDAGLEESNGVYGLETLAVHNTLGSSTTDVNGALVAAITTPDYYQGYIGLGVTQGKFGNSVVNPFISQLAETYGTIPSHSYGYTAGSFHSEPSVPASLILGGYDPLRFVNHNEVFHLNPDTRLPQARLRGVTVEAADPSKAPSSWNGSTTSLVSMNDSLMVVIDSSLPYLTMPQVICDRFAAALDLAFNETLGVYVYRTMDQYNSFLKGKPFSFTFSLSSWDNSDNFGRPLETRGVVNITLSSAAFAHVLRYPYKNKMIQTTDPAVPYFPLRRAKNVNEIVLGRVFMQEAYIITKYDEDSFSIYQAQFPPNAASNYSVVSIARSPNSEYPEYKGKGQPNGPSLNNGQTAGIVVAVLLLSAVCGATLWYCRRRRLRKRSAKQMVGSLEHQDDELKDAESAKDPPETPVSPVARMFTFLQTRRRTRMPQSPRGTDGGRSLAAEVGADASHERYEMPVPPEPVELAAYDVNSSDEATELGTEGSQQNLSEYEIARRKLQRQLQGPLPTYTPPAQSVSSVEGVSGNSDEGKSAQDISPVGHYRPEAGGSSSPVSPPSEGNNSNSLPASLPSPMTPRDPEWGTLRMYDLPSPLTVAPQYPPAVYGAPSSSNDGISNPSPTQPSFYAQSRHDAEAAGVGRSGSSSHRSAGRASPSSASAHSPLSDMPPSPTFQHTPIDQEEIVCLGPLPENVRLPLHNPMKPRRQPSVPKLIGPEGRIVTASPIPEDPADIQSAPQLNRAPPRSPSRAAPLPPATAVLASSSSASPRLSGDPRKHLRIDPMLSKRASSRRGSADTLGSNFTVEEEERIQVEFTRQQSLRNGNTGSAPTTPLSPNSCERIDAASELIHVPQVPDKRYSWEEDKR